MNGYLRATIEYKAMAQIAEGMELEINPCGYCDCGYGGTGDTKQCYETCPWYKEYRDCQDQKEYNKALKRNGDKAPPSA